MVRCALGKRAYRWCGRIRAYRVRLQTAFIGTAVTARDRPSPLQKTDDMEIDGRGFKPRHRVSHARSAVERMPSSALDGKR